MVGGPAVGGPVAGGPVWASEPRVWGGVGRRERLYSMPPRKHTAQLELELRGLSTRHTGSGGRAK